MKILITSAFLALSTIAVAGNDNFSIDIDCDGVSENVALNVLEQDFVLSVIASSNKKESSLTFGLGQSSRQDAICGISPKFSSGDAATKEMHLEMFGENSYDKKAPVFTRALSQQCLVTTAKRSIGRSEAGLALLH